jgi:uncharacterized membrane protein YbhN (UPF0104 family)
VSPVVDAETSQPGTRRESLTRLATIAFGVLTVSFGGVYIATRWDGVRQALETARPGWIALSIVFGVLLYVAGMFPFAALFAAAAPSEVSLLSAARVFYVSQLGKYLPGWVWPAVAVVTMSRKLGVKPRDAASVWLVSLIVSLLTGGLVGAIFTCVALFGESAYAFLWLLLLPLAFTLTYPAGYEHLLNAAMRLLRRQPITLALTPSLMRRVVGWSMLGWCLAGLHCWALVVAVGGSPEASLAPAIGGFALAFVAGTLFIPAPGGLGVREAVLAATLGGTLGAASLGSDGLLVVVLLSRVFLAILDFAMAGTVMALARLRERPRKSP